MSTPPGASPPRPTRSRAPEAGAVTLIELVAAAVLSGIVAAVTIEMLAGQARFAHLQSAREEMQQNTRAVLELMTSELRGADPHGIAEALPSSLTFRSPRAWGVVCSHTSARLAALFPSAASASLGTGEEFLAIPAVGGATEWQFLGVSDLTGNAAERGQAQAACGALDASVAFGVGVASLARMYGPAVVGGVPGTLGIPAGAPGLPAGTTLYLFDPVRYQIVPPPGAGEWWVRRNTGPAMQMHPLAGPVVPESGLVFGYFDSAGNRLWDLATQAARNRVHRIEVAVVARSRQTFGEPPLLDSASASVYLRNRY
jgi:type II secretory pathway pseudopilin PulG